MGGSPVQVLVDTRSDSDLTFPEAVVRLMEGEKIARTIWGNGDYGFLGQVMRQDGQGLTTDKYLAVKRETGVHAWMVSDLDVMATDWYVVGVQPSFATG